MLASDRAEFDSQIAMLCAGFNVPVGDRSEAYWLAFNRLGLVQFRRIIEAALGPDGPDKAPTVKQLWSLHHGLTKGSERIHGLSGSQASHTRLLEGVLSRFTLSPAQLVAHWDWHRSQDMELTHVTVPADPLDASRFPMRTLRAADL